MWQQPVPARVGPEAEQPIEFTALAELLGVLGNPVRLEMLRLLRFSHPLSEIRVRPHRQHAGLSPERSLARPTVLSHLNRLVEKGLVQAESGEHSGRAVPHYRVNPGRLYALIEDLRSLSTIYAGQGSPHDLTETYAGAVTRQATEGPRLTLVHGVYEGKIFPLTEDTAQEGDWTIGRSRHAPVCLDYDPYVSTTHAAIRRRRREFLVRDLQAKNPTRLNWVPLPADSETALKPGDVIGVGRSMLVWTDA